MGPEQITILGLVGGIATAGLARLWVFGWTYNAKVAEMIERLAEKDRAIAEMTEDRNFWRGSTLQALGHTDKALDVAKTKKA